MKKYSQSLVDFLVNFQPKQPNKPNLKLANTLFEIWKDKNNQITKNIFKKPITISNNDIEDMKKEGLIETIADKIKITAKGSDIIKTMVLGDERSSFEDNGNNVDYKTASEYVKIPSKIKKQSKKNEDNFWKNILAQSGKVRMDKKVKKLITNELSPILSKYYENIPLWEIFNVFHKYNIYPLQEDGTPWSGFLNGRKECGSSEANNQKVNFNLGTKQNDIMVEISDCVFVFSWCGMGSGRLELNGYLS